MQDLKKNKTKTKKHPKQNKQTKKPNISHALLSGTSAGGAPPK